VGRAAGRTQRFTAAKKPPVPPTTAYVQTLRFQVTERRPVAEPAIEEQHWRRGLHVGERWRCLAASTMFASRQNNGSQEEESGVNSIRNGAHALLPVVYQKAENNTTVG